jgi:hypothetical protein
MDTRQTTSVPALLCRILWMMVGPITLCLLALSVAERRDALLTLPNLAYFPVLGGTMLARWLEFKGGHPKTSTGEPATTEHLRRYLFGTAILGLGVWIVATLPLISR